MHKCVHVYDFNQKLGQVLLQDVTCITELAYDVCLDCRQKLRDFFPKNIGTLCRLVQVLFFR